MKLNIGEIFNNAILLKKDTSILLNKGDVFVTNYSWHLSNTCKKLEKLQVDNFDALLNSFCELNNCLTLPVISAIKSEMKNIDKFKPKEISSLLQQRNIFLNNLAKFSAEVKQEIIKKLKNQSYNFLSEDNLEALSSLEYLHNEFFEFWSDELEKEKNLSQTKQDYIATIFRQLYEQSKSIKVDILKINFFKNNLPWLLPEEIKSENEEEEQSTQEILYGDEDEISTEESSLKQSF